MCAKYSLPPFDWLKLSHHLVSGESTLHEVTLFEAQSRIFLPTAQSCAALFCCRLAIQASSLGWLGCRRQAHFMKYRPFSPRGVFLGSRSGGVPSSSRNLEAISEQ